MWKKQSVRDKKTLRNYEEDASLISTLNANGLSIRYWSGSKPDSNKASIVFFHGNAFSIDNWISIGTLDLVEKKGHVVYAIDLPAGRASKSDKIEKEKPSDYVPILEEIFSKLGIGNSPIVLVGPSLGGGFALAYGLAHPEALSALVLISPSTKSLDEEEFSKIEAPVLLIWGDKDDIFPLNDYGMRLKSEFPHSKLIILKGARHAAYLDKPEEFHELLLDFLDEVL
jgi:abhydrolase domain-containing protein 14